MDEVLFETVKMALVVVGVTGVFASAAMEMVKQAVVAVSNYRVRIPAEWMTVMTGAIAAASTFYVLTESEVRAIPALMAAVIAVYAPKIAHDLVRRHT